MSIERTVLAQLISNEDYTRKTIPFLKEEYFLEKSDKIVFQEIKKFLEKYNNLPTKESLLLELDSRRDISEREHKYIIDSIESLEIKDFNKKWLMDNTEKFCKDKAVYNAILKGINIIQGKDKKYTAEAIPDILTEALAVGFDSNVGHDYTVDGELRFDFYRKKEERIEFDLDFFNKITKGGLPQKTLNIVIAGTGVGKSLFMCHHAAACLMQGLSLIHI